MIRQLRGTKELTYSVALDELNVLSSLDDICEFTLKRDGDWDVERNDESYRKRDSQTGGYFRGDDRGTIDTSGYSGEGNDNAAIYESNGTFERTGDYAGIDRNQNGEISRGNLDRKYAAYDQIIDDLENLLDELLFYGIGESDPFDREYNEFVVKDLGRTEDDFNRWVYKKFGLTLKRIRGEGKTNTENSPEPPRNFLDHQIGNGSKL